MALTDHGCFKIGSVEFKPQSIVQTNESLATEESGRSMDGVMHTEWIRSKIRKWEITMPPMSPSEVSTLMALVQGKIYNITIYDITLDSEVTVQVYTSNSNATCYSGILRTNGIWTDISFSAIEM